MINSIRNTEEESRLARAEMARRSVYHTLLYTVFQRPREADKLGLVIALSSVSPGEGVTYITKELVHELAKCEYNSVAGINARFLRSLHDPSTETFRESLNRASSRSRNGMSQMRNADADDFPDAHLTVSEGHGPWEGSWQFRRDCIELLRKEFDQTVIDCPSLRESGDVLSVAPFVDGVILVIEANRTRREQILHAEQSIAAAHGKILGYVLNKRTYEVPGWIYHRL